MILKSTVQYLSLNMSYHTEITQQILCHPFINMCVCVFKRNMDILWMAIEQDLDAQRYYKEYKNGSLIESAVSEEGCSFVLLSKNSIIILIF